MNTTDGTTMRTAGLFVTGTDTGAGKTLVSCAILAALRRRGLRTAAFKPVETGCRREGSALLGEDCRRLAAAAGRGQEPGQVAAYLFAEPAAPLVSAEAEGVTIERDEVHSRYRAIASDADFVLVESAGGLMVPLAEGWTTRDLARELGLPALVVVASRLGCLNHALLTLEGLRAAAIPVAGYVVNEIETGGAYALALRTHRNMLRRFAHVAEIGVVPQISATEADDLDRLAELAEAHLDLDALVRGD
jgi:dethiobiotin synthetase